MSKEEREYTKTPIDGHDWKVCGCAGCELKRKAAGLNGPSIPSGSPISFGVNLGGKTPKVKDTRPRP